MSVRPEHFFAASPFLRWTLIPFLLAFAIGMPLLMETWTGESLLVVPALSAIALLYALALLSPARFNWAGRAVAGMVFVFFLAYAIEEWSFSSDRFRLVEPRSRASPRNALLGLIVIGLPCLGYALRKRRTELESSGAEDAWSEAES